jgi:hypothetical protein
VSQPFPLDRAGSQLGSSSSSSSFTSETAEVNPETGERRFTRKEKGKGRAMITPIEVIDDEEVEGEGESIRVTGLKRKAGSVDDLFSEEEEAATDGQKDGDEAVKVGGAAQTGQAGGEEDGIEEYSELTGASAS